VVTYQEHQRWARSLKLSIRWNFNCHLARACQVIVRRAVSHFRVSFCEFLSHSLIQKLLASTQRETRTAVQSSMATARTETTRGPTYLMPRAIGATQWQKGFICRCHYLRCHYSPLTVEVTLHMDRSLEWLASFPGSSPAFCRILYKNRWGGAWERGYPMATLTSMSARVPPQCRHILQSTGGARPVSSENRHPRKK